MTEQECLELLRSQPKNYYLYYQLAQMALKQKDREKMKEYLLRVAELNADYKPFNVNMGLAEIFKSEGNFDKAAQHYKIQYYYCSDTKQKVECFLRIAQCLKKLQKFKEARFIYELAISSDPKNHILFYKLAKSYFKENQIKQAIDNLLKAQTLVPDNPKVNLWLGIAHLNMFDACHTTQALSVFAGLIDRNEHDLQAIFGLVKGYEQLNNFEASISILEKYIKSCKEESEVISELMVLLGNLYYKNGQFDKAHQLYAKVLERKPGHIGALVQYANYQSIILGNFEKAAKFYSAVLKYDKNNFTAHFRLGQLYFEKLNNKNQALVHFRSAQAINPTSASCYFCMGDLFISQEEYEAAIPILK